MIIFLYGADTFRSRRLLQEMKNKFIKDIDPEANSLNVIDGRAATIKEISDKMNTGSLFARKRLVVVENIFQNKKEKIFAELADYLKKFSADGDNILIFWDEEIKTDGKSLKAEAKKLFTFLAKQKYSQESKTLTSAQLLSFIKKEAGRYDKEIGAPAASLLINMTSGDLWTIAQEIKKLAFRNSEKTISPAEIKEMVSDSFNENIFALTDALSARQKNIAIKLLEEQIAAGVSDEYLLAMLIRQFKILWQIRAALDAKTSPAELASRLKLHPYVVKKSETQVRNFSAETLKNYFNRLVKLDFLNKNGLADIQTELTLLISGL